MKLEEPMSVAEGLLKKIAALRAELQTLREENFILTQKRMGKRGIYNAYTKMIQASSM